jgi:hypothetical protein
LVCALCSSTISCVSTSSVGSNTLLLSAVTSVATGPVTTAGTVSLALTSSGGTINVGAVTGAGGLSLTGTAGTTTTTISSAANTNGVTFSGSGVTFDFSGAFPAAASWTTSLTVNSGAIVSATNNIEVVGCLSTAGTGSITVTTYVHAHAHMRRRPRLAH